MHVLIKIVLWLFFNYISCDALYKLILSGASILSRSQKRFSRTMTSKKYTQVGYLTMCNRMIHQKHIKANFLVFDFCWVGVIFCVHIPTQSKVTVLVVDRKCAVGELKTLRSAYCTKCHSPSSSTATLFPERLRETRKCRQLPDEYDYY